MARIKKPQLPPERDEAPWWTRHRDLIAAIGVLVGLLVAAVTVWAIFFRSDRASSQPSSAIARPATRPTSKPKSRFDEIEARTFWVNPPQLYEPVAGDFSTEVVNLGLLDDDLEAYSPAELVDYVAQYDYITEHTLFIAGHVIDTAFRRSDFGLGREYTVAGKDSSAIAVIGAPDDAVSTCCFKRGDVIYALVRVGALGDMRVRGRVRRGVYVVTTTDYSATINQVESRREISEIGSRALRAATAEAWDAK